MLNSLFFILLIEGFITISVEILAIRQLMPFYGGSIIITSLVIGVFLLFLAIGYWRGGLHQDKFYYKISKNFSLSLLWVGFGLSYSFIAWYYLISKVKIDMPFMMSITVYLLAVIAPVVYWLGQTVPLTTNLFSQQLRVSHISGRALFLSTIGSFMGAIFTALVLFQYLGVAWTVFINCILLFCLILYLQPYSKLSIFTLTGLVFSLVIIYQLNVAVERAVFIEANNYANYQVVTAADFSKVLVINNSSSSKITNDKRAFLYIQYLRDLLFKQLHMRNKNILVIGAGGFTFSAAGTYQNQFTYVDIDPAIKEVAEKHFLKEPIKGRFTGQDARQFLQENKQQYDVIISDVYTHQMNIPPNLLTVEYFQNIARHLNPTGLFIANIIANPFYQDAYSKGVHQTLTAVFPFCNVIPLSWTNELSNILYICSANTEKAAVYTDNLNPSTLDSFNILQ